MAECDCAAETTGRWAGVHSAGCASLGDIFIGQYTRIRVRRDGDWVVVYTEDGVGVTTVSLTVSQAIDMASLLRGSAVAIETNGGVELRQLADNECVIAPGLIYRKEPRP
jgi:hypothetical protein